MCRIIGFLQNTPQNYDKNATIVAMRDSLAHGGPDDAGVYLGDGIALGHRRLSILDLSAKGHQPMLWQQYVIVHNGEVYNFKEIRAVLQKAGFEFKTETDTEVILKAFHHWGREAVHRFRGMFAFAIWNTQTKKLLLCRDRVGVKPLYWYEKDGLFMFASEQKGFHQHPQFDTTIDQQAVSLFLQQGYIHSPRSIYKQVKKLEPGSFLEVDLKNWTIQKETYWNAKDKYENQDEIYLSEGDALERLESILLESFQLRLVSDVPVGIFLSGGIDSSLVTALLQKHSNQQLKTFTIGFENPAFNEAGHAQAVAQHLDTDHAELICTEADFKAILPSFTTLYDEPFGDSSGIPTYLVAQLAKEQVKVSLSADGGDELFGGYTKYEMAANFFPKFQRIPGVARKPIASLSQLIDPRTLDRLAPRLPFLNRYTNIANKFHKVRQALSTDDMIEFFNVASTFISPHQLQRLHQHYQVRYEDNGFPKEDGLLSYLGMIDIQTYLEGDIMTKVDRATMHVALEGREPLLDHHIIEFALSLPDHLKIRGNKTKYLLRQLLYKYVPRDLIERPKQGFAIPIGQWLRSFLQEDLQALANDKDFLQTFELNEAYCKKLIHRFVEDKKYVNEYVVWFLLVLYKWKIRF